MTGLSLLTWALVVAALVLGILAGHFGWGKRWPGALGKLHPDYLTGLDYLVTEQPDRALDMFLKLMDANADTIETHFALGSLYRRRGEVERAIRIHQNLLARSALAPEHREQALLALAQDYLRAGLLDRAEGLFQQVSEVPRLRASALDALRLVYERQHDWQQALGAYRQLARIKAAPPRIVAAHYLCELAALAIERGDTADARRLLREARKEASPFPRAALLRAQIAEGDGQPALAVRLPTHARTESPELLQHHLPHLGKVLDLPARGGKLGAFPVAGRGPGCLRVTKARTKESLPARDKPLIPHAGAEALPAGAAALIFITGSSKRAIEDHFDSNPELESVLQAQGKQELLDTLRGILPSWASCVYIRQPAPLGLGHAVLCARPVVGDAPFMVHLADDLIDAEVPCLKQMVDVFATHLGSVLGVQNVPKQDTDKTGIVTLEHKNALRIAKLW